MRVNRFLAAILTAGVSWTSLSCSRSDAPYATSTDARPQVTESIRRGTVIVPPTVAAVAPTATGRAYELAILGYSCQADSADLSCQGDVENISDHALPDVEIVAAFADPARRAPSSVSSVRLQKNPLGPGERSHWEINSTNHDPRLTSFAVEFRRADGATIATRDDRPHR